MPRPIAAGVFGMARTTAPPQISEIDAIVVPAMIDTTSVDGAINGFSLAPTSRNDCGLTASTIVSRTKPATVISGLADQIAP